VVERSDRKLLIDNRRSLPVPAEFWAATSVGRGAVTALQGRRQVLLPSPARRAELPHAERRHVKTDSLAVLSTWPGNITANERSGK
jgi:hypothetical protein